MAVPWFDFEDREEFSTAVGDVIEDRGCKGVVLAGFMRILSASFINRFPNRILNIHPSLLPAFPGAHAVANALEYGAKVSGVTVHFVDEQVDHGPIVAQRTVPILEDDTVASLHARIQIQEHMLYPEAVRAFVSGTLTAEGRKVVWR
jgi:phosphoribosylglycinamide formyltransferase-1